jgi:hypothetical protein
MTDLEKVIEKYCIDINGSGNILRKVIGDAWLSQPIVDLMLNPVKINFYEETIVS